jgi:hypothetical protein
MRKGKKKSKQRPQGNYMLLGEFERKKRKEKKQKLYLNLIPKNRDQYKHYKSGN